MKSATSASRAFVLVAGIVVALGMAGAGVALAQSMPDGENGRYSMVPVPDGVLRLDTRTGAVSNCNNSGAGWACYALPDERRAFDAEIGRLQAEIDKFKAQLAQREPAQPSKEAQARPDSSKSEPKAADGGRKIEIPLPSDEDVDRVMSFLERAWRRLTDMASRVQRDASGKI